MVRREIPSSALSIPDLSRPHPQRLIKPGLREAELANGKANSFPAWAHPVVLGNVTLMESDDAERQRGACGRSLTWSQPTLGGPMSHHPALHPPPRLQSLSLATAAAQQQRWREAPELRRAQAGLCAVSHVLNHRQHHLCILGDGEPSPWLLQPHIKGLFPFFLGFPSHTFLSILQICRGMKSWCLPFALVRAGGIQLVAVTRLYPEAAPAWPVLSGQIRSQWSGCEGCLIPGLRRHKSGPDLAFGAQGHEEVMMRGRKEDE